MILGQPYPTFFFPAARKHMFAILGWPQLVLPGMISQQAGQGDKKVGQRLLNWDIKLQ